MSTTPSRPSRTIMLIDGNSLTYRAFFALPTDLATASGQVTNAVLGFTTMLTYLVREQKPDSIIVAFDRPEPTFRHERVPTYKGNRDAAPDILRQQMGLVRQVLDVLHIPTVDLAGFEADDIIATLAEKAKAAEHQVLIVTGDRDAYQLVDDPFVRVIYNKRGVSDYANYDEAGIEERTGVSPAEYVQYAAMRGDNSDNLPGVPGVGEKTAAKLIKKYGGLDGIFAHLDEQTPKLRENLAAAEDQVRTNAEVMVLLRDLDIEVDFEAPAMDGVDPDEVRKLFDFLEFRGKFELLDEALDGRLGGGAGGGSAGTSGLEVLEAELTEVTTSAEAAEVIGRLAGSSTPLAVAPAWSGSEGRSPLDGLALVVDGESAEVAWLPWGLVAGVDEVRAGLQSLLGPNGRPLAAHGAKALMRRLGEEDVDVHALAVDTMLAAYLLDPAEARYLLGDLLVRYLATELPDDAPAAEGQLDLDGAAVPPSLEAARRALAVECLVAPLTKALDAQGLRALYDDIEVPLVRVLAKMEEVGIAVDRAELERLNRQLVDECATLTQLIKDDAGEHAPENFNVNSTLQLREVLFDKLGLTPQKKTKTGFSTDAASLEKLAGQHPIIDHLLRYREVEKLRSTYGEGLLNEVGPDDRIHATFNQTVARTGRLSSDAPNLHNIPVRTEEGRAFRRAFVPGPGFELLVADYNQIELRCIAHLAEDPGLIGAFESGSDIHNETAARIFGVDHADVTIEQRSKAKMVSYGLAYGMEAYGLGQRLSIPTEEAADILGAYFEAFPSVKSYMEQTVAEARERGYTETLFGRRRQIPELSSSNFRIRQAGERQAMNAGIQGLAADIFKVALVALDRALEGRAARSRLILQVHDEVVLEVTPEEREDLAALTRTTLESAADLRVPLEVNLAFGTSWADAKS